MLDEADYSTRPRNWPKTADQILVDLDVLIFTLQSSLSERKTLDRCIFGESGIGPKDSEATHSRRCPDARRVRGRATPVRRLPTALSYRPLSSLLEV